MTQIRLKQRHFILCLELLLESKCGVSRKLELMHNFCCMTIDIDQEACKRLIKAYLHGTTLSHATSLRQAYDMT